MPLEALAAIGLTANILQFVEVSARVLAKSKQIYASSDGTSGDALNVAAVASQLQASTDRLKDSICPPETTTVWTAADASLEKLRIQCCHVNQELQSVLRKLAVEGKATKWKSFKKALSHEWENGKLEAIQSSLFTLRDEMHFQITVSLRENIDLLALLQTETFQQLDATGQTILNATLENRSDVLDALDLHIHELRSVQQQSLKEVVHTVREDLVDMAASLGDRVNVSQRESQHQIDAVAEAIQVHETHEHDETRRAIEVQAAAIEDQNQAQHNETRAVVADASNDVRSMIDRVINQIHTVHERLAQDHLVQQERSREEFRSWIIALMAQQARVIEAQTIAIKAAHKRSSSSASKKVRKALKVAQASLKRALEVLIELATRFEKEIGLRYRMVQELIFYTVGSMDPAAYVKQLLNPQRREDATELTPPRTVEPGFSECPPAFIVPSIVLTDAADPEIEAAFLHFFDCQLGRSSQRQSARVEMAITSGAWDMAFMSISWSVASTGPFWGLNRGYLRGLSLQDWSKFKNQKWVFVYYDMQLHIIEVTNSHTDAFLSKVSLRPNTFIKLVQFRWELIAGENRLVALQAWTAPFSSNPPKEEFMKTIRKPYSVRKGDFSSSELSVGIYAHEVQSYQSKIINNTPIIMTEYGQPIRHALPRTVWGLLAYDWEDNTEIWDDEGYSKVRVHWEIERRKDSAFMEPQTT